MYGGTANRNKQTDVLGKKERKKNRTKKRTTGKLVKEKEKKRGKRPPTLPNEKARVC